MAWDLAISDYGDLIMSGNRDLAGVSGDDLTSQRITTRLLVHRGSWFYDPEGTFGSDLYQALGKPTTQDVEIDSRVRDALREMEDVLIESVDWKYTDDEKSIVVRVEYTDNPQEEESSLQSEASELTSTVVTVPLAPGGGA